MEEENDREVELTSRSFLISIVSSNFPGSLEEIGWRYIARSMHNIHARIIRLVHPSGCPWRMPQLEGGSSKAVARRYFSFEKEKTIHFLKGVSTFSKQEWF
jgi:hypothetical protein